MIILVKYEISNLVESLTEQVQAGCISIGPKHIGARLYADF